VRDKKEKEKDLS